MKINISETILGLLILIASILIFTIPINLALSAIWSVQCYMIIINNYNSIYKDKVYLIISTVAFLLALSFQMLEMPITSICVLYPVFVYRYVKLFLNK